MRVYDVIFKKRNGGVNTFEEIQYLVQEYTRGNIPDYQVSAWLMAAFLKGLNADETFYLTKAMIHTGKILDLGLIDRPKIDKHSTGGVGDKVSLILAPAVASCGVVVPMTSGRGLGFTGGTLDKLSSIPGFKVNLSEEEYISILKSVGFAMTGQTDSIAPADKKIYALRDVTATVESIPFITSSILSKKLAEGADAIVMDVKFGSGAFMKTKNDAVKLARSLVDTARRMEKKVICILTNMDQPLGRAIGNSLEVIESIDCLKGGGYRDVIEVTSILGGYMLLLGEVVDTIEEGEFRIREALRDGKAFEKFKESIMAQGGDKDSIVNIEKLPQSKYQHKIISPYGGYINAINTEFIGMAASYLGAGRFRMDDNIDYASGIEVLKKSNDSVVSGEALATLHYNNDTHLKEAVVLMKNAYRISREKSAEYKLIHEVIQ